MRSRSHRPRAGFTLVEVIVAISLSALVMLGARLLLDGLGEDAHRIANHARTADRDANAEHVLRSLFARLELGTDAAGYFSGDERVTRFTTWCDRPPGWLERCRAAVAFDSSGGQLALVAVVSTGEITPLRTGFRSGTLRYLTDASNGGSWFRSWGAGITAPLAVGVIIDGDTTIVRIGERG